MLSELTGGIATYYLVIFTGKRTVFYSEIGLTNSHKHVLASDKSAL